MDNQKEKSKKKINWWIIGSLIVAISFFGSMVYYYVSGGQTGIEHKAVQSKVNKINSQNSERYKKNATLTTYPTIEEVTKYCQKKLGTQDLTKINVETLKKTIQTKYSERVSELALAGKLLSSSMTPGQIKQGELVLAKSDPNNKDYIGLSSKTYTTSIYDDSYTSSEVTSSLSSQAQSGYGYSFNDGKIVWSKYKDSINVSQPFISPFQSNLAFNDKFDKNNQYLSGIVFVQINKNDMTIKDLKDLANEMTLNVNNTSYQAAGKNDYTSISDTDKKIYSDGMQNSSITGSDISSNNQKIFYGSIIPITFDLSAKQMAKDGAGTQQTINASLVGVNSYDLTFTKSLVASFQ